MEEKMWSIFMIDTYWLHLKFYCFMSEHGNNWSVVLWHSSKLSPSS